MDRLLAASSTNGRMVRISSRRVPDYTNRIHVSGDDMLVSALSQMNRSSRAYVFLDQALIRDGALLELVVNESKAKYPPPKPDFYIRGAITQLDENSRSSQVDGEVIPLIDEHGITASRGGTSLSASVVTVDLHLVAFPSRQIIPGGSVSNSMVVSRRGLSSGFTGKIVKAGLGFNLEISRVESTGQAVRHLIELGLIELLGRHSGVAYWDCLSLEPTNTRNLERDEREFTATPEPMRIEEAQRLLVQIGALSKRPTGKMDLTTKRAVSVFQANQGLIANGVVNYDTIQHLRAEAARSPLRVTQAKPAHVYGQTIQPNHLQQSITQVPVPVTPTRPRGNEGYQSLSHFLSLPQMSN